MHVIQANSRISAQNTNMCITRERVEINSRFLDHINHNIMFYNTAAEIFQNVKIRENTTKLNS